MTAVSAERDSARQEVPEQLRNDVKLLGEMLGTVLAESGGEDLLADVEKLRHAVIGARDGSVTTEEITELVAVWPLERAKQVARAFTVYFHLANLAEEHQRMRALRERDDAASPPRESLAAAVRAIRETDGGEERLAELVAGMEFHPVLTAHPTEARRRAVSTSILRISAQLDAWHAAHEGSSAAAEAHRRLLEEIDLLWRTSQLRYTKLDPLDEVRTALAAFDETIFAIIPEVYRALDAAIDPEGTGTRPPRATPFVRYGSWIGGDRDGNPFVTHEVTREAMTIQSEHVLRGLETTCGKLARTLTAYSNLTPASPALLDTISEAKAGHPTLMGEITQRSPNEPHRQLLLLATARLRATRERDADLAYADSDEFLADLRLVQDSLAAAGAGRQAYGELQHLIWQAETFGFHLAELEIRQHSEVHAAALAELEAGGPLSERTEEVLNTIRTVSWIQERFGVEACRRYIVSFSQSPAHLVAVRALAREIQAYPDDAAVWRTAPGIANSAGTLALHLAGNIQHYVGAKLGGSGYQRDRPAEFGRRDVPRGDLLREIERAIQAAENTLPKLGERDLAADFPEAIGGRMVRTDEFLLHIATHLCWHLGQVDYHRRLVTGEAGKIGALAVTELSTARPSS